MLWQHIVYLCALFLISVASLKQLTFYDSSNGDLDLLYFVI
jgi:hypothetical protein